MCILHFHSSLSFRVSDQIYVFSVPKEPEADYYNPSSPVKPQATDNDVHTNDIAGNHSCAVTCIQNIDNTKFPEKPINVGDEISPKAVITATCPDANLKQISTNTQCSKICTGWQHLPLPTTYQPYHMNQSSDLQLQMPTSLHSKLAQLEQKDYSADFDRGLWSFNDENSPKELCVCSTQETQRPGPQELVLNSNNSIKFWNYPATFTCETASTVHELTAFERKDLYIKPFYSVQPS